MNKDELIKLREELAKKKFYCAIFNDVDNSDSRIVEIDDKRISGIEKMDQTHEVLKKCEAFIEKVLITSYENGVPVDKIGLASPFGVICEAKTARDYVHCRNAYLKCDQGKNITNYHIIELDNVEERFKTDVKQNYFPVKISLDPVFTAYNDMDAYDVSEEKKMPIFKETITGIVNFDKFVSGLNELGYEFKFYDVNPKDYTNYLDEFMNIDESRKYTSGFVIIADLTKNLDYKSNKTL